MPTADHKIKSRYKCAEDRGKCTTELLLCKNGSQSTVLRHNQHVWYLSHPHLQVDWDSSIVCYWLAEIRFSCISGLQEESLSGAHGSHAV